jgi:hypothetical protein
MKLIYLGADVPSNRTILESMNVKHVGFSFWRAVQRGLPKNKRYLLNNYFQPDMKIHVHPGIPEKTTLTEAEFDAFAADYEDFLAHNIDRIESFIEIDHPQITKLMMSEQREAAWSEETKFWATLREDHSYADLVDMCQQYTNVAIPYSIIESDVSMAAKTRALSSQYNTTFHALACAKPDNLRQIHVATASTQSWLSPMMRGETIVWSGTKLVRYPKKMKEQARPRYKAVYEKAGLDFGKIIDDDPIEVTKLALWSYDQFEERFNMVNNPFLSPPDDDDESSIYQGIEDFKAGRIHHIDLGELSDNSGYLQEDDYAETTPAVVDKRGGQMRKLNTRAPSEMTTLPVFGTDFNTVVEKDEQGNDVIKDVTMVRSNANSLRMCDTCFVAANCPAFQVGNTCAFNLPVEIKTKEQVRSLLNAIVEMQAQRVAFSRFAEELNGGYPDPNTSQEMDRLFKMFKMIKDLEDTSSFVKMTVEARNSGGVLSQIFGERAQNLNELPNGGLSEEQVTRIIQHNIEE